jgi:hypothetical protein
LKAAVCLPCLTGSRFRSPANIAGDIDHGFLPYNTSLTPASSSGNSLAGAWRGSLYARRSARTRVKGAASLFAHATTATASIRATLTPLASCCRNLCNACSFLFLLLVYNKVRDTALPFCPLTCELHFAYSQAFTKLLSTLPARRSSFCLAKHRTQLNRWHFVLVSPN